MIEDQIKRLHTSKRLNGESDEEPHKQNNDNSSEYGEEQNSQNEKSEDEFFDCLDDEKDIQMLNSKHFTQGSQVQH